MTPERKKLVIGYLCGITATLCWGFHTVIIRWMVKQGVDSSLIGDLRLLIGSAVLFVIVAFSYLKNKKVRPIAYSKFFWLISVSLAVSFILFHKGLEFTIASDAILIEAFAPVMVLVLVMLFIPQRIRHIIKHHRLPQMMLLLVITGSIGSSLLLLNEPTGMAITTKSKFIGDFMEFGAMFAWALVMLGIHEYQARQQAKNIALATAQFLFVAAVIMAFFVPWSEIFLLTSTQWAWIFVLGVFSTGLSYVLWHIASQYLDILPLVTLFNLVSIFTVITESFVLGLDISWKLVIGGGLILFAATQATIMNAKYKLLDKSEGGGSSHS